MENKIITIYELMGLIKDGKAPIEIKYDGKIYRYNNGDYIDEYFNSLFDKILEKYDMYTILTEHEVEILPEENDEWEDICELFDDSRYNFSDRQNGMTQEDRRLLDSNFKTLGETINQLIKNQKYLKEKLESKDE